MQQAQQKRSKLFVNPEVQGPLLKRVAMYWFLYHLLLWHAMFLYRYMHHHGEVLAGARPLSVTQLYLNFTMMNYSLIVCCFAVAPLVIFDMLKFSNRIVRPLKRIRQTFENLRAGGTPQPIGIRENDMWQMLLNRSTIT